MIASERQVVLPGEIERRLFPLAFCRECGQEHLMARCRSPGDGHEVAFRSRADGARSARLTERTGGARGRVFEVREIVAVLISPVLLR